MQSSHNSLRKPFSRAPGRPRDKASSSRRVGRLRTPDGVRRAFYIILNSQLLPVTAQLAPTMPAKHSLIANEDIVEQLELNETE